MQIVRGGIFEQGPDTTAAGGIVSQDQDIVPRLRQVGPPPRPVVMAGRDGPPHPVAGRIDRPRSSVPDRGAGICQPADTFAVGLPTPRPGADSR